jgi:ERF superfamily
MTEPKTQDAPDLLSQVEPKQPEKKAAEPKRRGPKPGAKRAVAAAPDKPAPTTAVAKVEHLPPPTPTNMLSIIANAAMNKNVDVAKMRELLTMQREIMAEEARMAFTQDFVAMSGKMPSVNKDGRIEIDPKPGARSQRKQILRWATFENMHRLVTPILREHGFGFWSEPDLGDDRSPIIMRGHLDHVRGHGQTCAIPLPFETSGSKNNVQGVGSSLSYGRRYCLMNLCNIVSHAPEDRDRDGAEPKPEVEAVSMEQVQNLQALFKDCGEGFEDKFLVKYNIERIVDLPASNYQEAVNAVEGYKSRQQKAS